MDKRPEFRPPTIYTSDLNKVAAAAFGEIHIEGGEANKVPGGWQFHIPPDELRLMVRVTAGTNSCNGSGSGSGGSGGSGGVSGGPSGSGNIPRTPYSWESVEPNKCGGWILAVAPYAITGNTTTNPAYERNNLSVADGSIQRIRPRFTYFDIPTRSFVTEWEFTSGGASGQRRQILTILLDSCLQFGIPTTPGSGSGSRIILGTESDG